ncbi:inositol monophosphatase [Candidatus Daviesbacteria bacterium]|nr:inositol monophosphatase [Candidatus Daviesbacteria bacterium]
MYQKFIEQALQKASQIASANFGKVSGVTKSEDNNQVLTETDVQVGKTLIALIQKEFPEHNIIDEESGVINKNSEFTWVIDPIDGTSNFAQGIPNYGIMIGLLKGSTPIAGGIALPFFKEICIAEKGQGAFCNGEKLSVTKETGLLSTLVAYQIDGHQENPDFTRKECQVVAEIVLNVRNLRNSGSCFDVVTLAKGKYGGYLIRTGKIWDVVASNIMHKQLQKIISSITT